MIKKYIWVCVGKRGQKREIRAESWMDAGAICKKKYGFWPITVDRKVFERTEHLTQRPFEGLKELIGATNE